jgi:hypothetical protein
MAQWARKASINNVSFALVPENHFDHGPLETVGVFDICRE